MTTQKYFSETESEVWRQTLLPESTILSEVIRNLDASSLQIVMVVSKEGTLLGTITDGDVRRGLLRGLDMSSPIDTVIHRESIVVPPQMSREMVLHLMQANAINALPVVDESRQVVGLHLLNELLTPTHRPNMMVIMAGGQGTRLRPHTENCPKPMLTVGGKPMMEHIIERAKSEGFHHFIIAIHYLGHIIEEYFGDGSHWHVQIEYLHEDKPMGTAGALALLNQRPTLPFLVSNGDVLTDIHYSELLDFHSSHGAMCTMAVRLHEWQHPFGVVRTKGMDIIGFEEKPVFRNHINAGIYVLEPSALNVLKPNELCDMPTLFSRLQGQASRTIVYPMHEPWLDVGREDDLNLARANKQPQDRGKIK